MGSVLRRIDRSRAKNYNITVPLLNEPGKHVEIPVKYRDNLLKSYSIRAADLSGIGFHMVCVVEGIVFGIVANERGRAKIVLHILELHEQENITLIGQDLYNYWTSLPQVLSYEELKARYGEMAGSIGAEEVDWNSSANS